MPGPRVTVVKCIDLRPPAYRLEGGTDKRAVAKRVPSIKRDIGKLVSMHTSDQE